MVLMKAIILFLLCLAMMNIGCASLDDHYYQAKRFCSETFNSKALNISAEKSKWNKRQYTQCVSDTANASANTSQAKATWAIVITTWVSIGANILVVMLSR